MPEGVLRPFAREDFPMLCAWFEADPVLDRALGPIDREWLEAVCRADPPDEFCWEIAGRVVAVVGVARPRDESEPWVVTDLAVCPGLRGKGHGRAALAAMLAHATGAQARWRAYVSRENPPAAAFLARLGWRVDAADSDDAMLAFDRGPGEPAGASRS